MDRREQDRLKTRAAILDAAEALMCEEGYAAVTSRRVGERAGLKSQLVHYHFGSMDDLFIEVYRRNDKRWLVLTLDQLTSSDPIAGVWKLGTAGEGADIIAELTAASSHRKVLKGELVESITRYRILNETMISKYFEDNQVDAGGYSPKVLAFLLAGVGDRLVTEAKIGVTEGHAEIMAFMDTFLQAFRPAQGARSPVSGPKITDGRDRNATSSGTDRDGQSTAQSPKKRRSRTRVRQPSA
jgi:TetR/AcrR family transcriptional regulator